MELQNKKVLIVGLAKTGVAVARFLASCGAEVTITDMKDELELTPFIDKLADLDITFDLGRHIPYTFLMADLIVVSPGVPMDIAPLVQARHQGRKVISEIELASCFITAPMVAITGTNGKTTTTTLTGSIFRECGFSTFVGGNIGKPLIDLVTSGEVADRVVVEVSSFQLEGIENFHPRVAVLLNITEDHLDRYESYQEYIDAKLRVFKNQTGEDYAVLNMDDPLVAKYAGTLKARIVPMSRLRQLEQGICCQDGKIIFSWDGIVAEYETSNLKLKGVHNLDNVMAALATTLLLGCDAKRAFAATSAFVGLPHRMEFVREVNSVSYYEDSKGTNVGSVVKSLESFASGITLIAGGKDKGGDYSPLADLVKERVAHLILIGEARERIRAALGALTETHMADSLEEAVSMAHEYTKAGGVVLFSPACSSFDMFKDYVERAERFHALVRALPDGGSH
jgi:UDP-N-acetylmuramoylalanine--D-glutamate ligase